MINHVQFPNLGIEVTINRVAFSVFGFDIYWYGVIFAFTIIRGASVALYLGKKLGINDDDFIDIIMLGTVFGISVPGRIMLLLPHLNMKHCGI